MSAFLASMFKPKPVRPRKLIERVSEDDGIGNQADIFFNPDDKSPVAAVLIERHDQAVQALTLRMLLREGQKDSFMLLLPKPEYYSWSDTFGQREVCKAKKIQIEEMAYILSFDILDDDKNRNEAIAKWQSAMRMFTDTPLISEDPMLREAMVKEIQQTLQVGVRHSVAGSAPTIRSRI